MPEPRRYGRPMPEVRAVFHRTKQVSVYPIEGDRFLIEAVLLDEVHDVRVEVEIVAARSQVRNGPFTAVCNLTHPNMDRLVGMRIARGFTQAARAAVGGGAGCHRVSELVSEVAQAAYQLHFVRFFAALPPTVRTAEDDPVRRRQAVLRAIPGMRNTCFSYHEENDAVIEQRATPLVLREQEMPRRRLP